MTTSWIDRFTIDDGRHLPDLVIDEDASTAAGEAQFRAACSCGRMPSLPAGSRDQALAVHIEHVKTKSSAPKGPGWLPEGARVIILAVAMLAVWVACYAAGEVITHETALTGIAAKAVVLASVMTGFILAFSLMVATRRYIAPTRA
ncbi:hypothetical protein [Streptomyces sp. NEAU-S7GS2]|uniref:hypothetical protein n=1 Tax=Streptomyces sp. NEAU-S7GS2 TaxID=2202000 RepID=UPI000D70135D|nr:hypothetical protein [Streptomyces sp. NEAU-S7GS2]AWN32620.1 hypothetical protein DKG71_42325 [Streptomyces sp. NEAU-S7GS2]